MGVQVAKKKRKRRSFSDEYKAEVVELVRSSSKGIAEICRDLDLGETVVRRWVQQADETDLSASSKQDEDVGPEQRGQVETSI